MLLYASSQKRALGVKGLKNARGLAFIQPTLATRGCACMHIGSFKHICKTLHIFLHTIVVFLQYAIPHEYERHIFASPCFRFSFNDKIGMWGLRCKGWGGVSTYMQMSICIYVGHLCMYMHVFILHMHVCILHMHLCILHMRVFILYMHLCTCIIHFTRITLLQL